MLMGNDDVILCLSLGFKKRS